MVTVFATREGLVGKTTSIGWPIDYRVPFVALPSTKALYRAVLLLNPANGLMCEALVLDVGPWNTHDDAYVFGDARPQAETGTDLFGRQTNKAGLDLGEYVFKKLQLHDNGDICWRFSEDVSSLLATPSVPMPSPHS